VSSASIGAPEEIDPGLDPPPPPTLGIWQLAVPSMATFAIDSLVGLIDFLIVGTLGSQAIAAVGLATQISFGIYATLAAVTTGTVALVARAKGAGDLREADRILRLSAALGIGLALSLMAAIPFAERIIALFGVEEPVVRMGASYLRIVLAFNAPLALVVVLSSGLRGVGDVRTPLVIGAGMNALNAIGDYALVFGKFGFPALGTDGAALATGVAFATGASVYLVLWARNHLSLPRGAWLAGFELGASWRILRIGIPTLLEQIAFQLGLLLFLGMMADFGTAAVSAYLIGVRILSFSFVPGIGFSIAASTLVGQNLGAGRPDLASRAGWSANRRAVVVMGTLGLAIIALSETITGWFGATGQETIALTISFIYILGAAQPLMAIEFTLGGALRGAGDTRFPLFSILTGLFAVRLGGALFIIHVFDAGLIAVWSCLLADYLVKALLLSLRFASGRWKAVRV
jgi:putative MATE family efflux protein